MSGAKPTVFVIDGDAAARDSLGLLLDCGGIVARTYGSAGAFLSEVRPQRNSCIVLDADLPGLSGLDLLNQLDQRGILIPAILSTSRGVTDYLRSEVDHVGATLIQKPYKPQELMALVRRFLDQWSLLGVATILLPVAGIAVQPDQPPASVLQLIGRVTKDLESPPIDGVVGSRHSPS